MLQTQLKYVLTIFLVLCIENLKLKNIQLGFKKKLQ